MRNNRKRRPTQPGEILREDVLPAAGLTQDKLARLLGVSRRTVSEILHERRPVTTDMAHRLARAFGTSPEMWLGLQQDVDLWDTHHGSRKTWKTEKRMGPFWAHSNYPDFPARWCCAVVAASGKVGEAQVGETKDL